MTDSEYSPDSEPSTCVVVYDDHTGVRQLLTLALETAGFDVVEVATEIELQRLLTALHPDALLVDTHQSEMAGLNLVSRMRARRDLRGVPILFLAGTEDDQFKQQAIAAGADWFGLRPVGMLDLQNQVAALTHRKRAGHRRVS